MVASYQQELKAEEFQVWTLKVNEDSSATVICTDGNDRVLKSQHIPFTDFQVQSATVWVEFGTAMLPSEH